MADLLYRFIFSGLLPAGDVFQYGFYASTAGTPTMTQAAADADVCQAAWFSASPSWKTFYRPTTVWQFPKVEWVDPATGAIFDFLGGSDTHPGTSSSTGMLPGSNAVCITLRTGTTGPRGRGRFYMPAPDISVVGLTGRISTSVRTTYLSCLKAGFTALHATARAWTPVVYSGMAHAFHPITSLEMGDVMDSQRRRRNALTESRAALAWP